MQFELDVRVPAAAQRKGVREPGQRAEPHPVDEVVVAAVDDVADLQQILAVLLDLVNQNGIGGKAEVVGIAEPPAGRVPERHARVEKARHRLVDEGDQLAGLHLADERLSGLRGDAVVAPVGRAADGNRADPARVDLAVGHHGQRRQRRGRRRAVVGLCDDDLGQFVDEEPHPGRQPGRRHQADVAGPRRRVGGNRDGKADAVGGDLRVVPGFRRLLGLPAARGPRGRGRLLLAGDLRRHAAAGDVDVGGAEKPLADDGGLDGRAPLAACGEDAHDGRPGGLRLARPRAGGEFSGESGEQPPEEWLEIQQAVSSCFAFVLHRHPNLSPNL